MNRVTGKHPAGKSSVTLAVVWWSSIGFLLASAGVRVWVEAERIQSAAVHVAVTRGATLGIILSATLTASFLLLYVWIRPSIQRAKVLSERFPRAQVLTAQKTKLLPRALNPYTGSGNPHLRAAFTLVVDESGIGFWTGRRFPVQFACIPWVAITELSVGSVILARPLPSIVVKTTEDAPSGGLIEFVPCRSGLAAAFAILDPARTRKVADDISRFRPTSVAGRK